MNLKEELNQVALESNSKLEQLQNSYKKELEDLNNRYNARDLQIKKELTDKQQELIEKATKLLNKL